MVKRVASGRVTRLGAAALVCAVLCQCETQRTVKSVRSTGWTFDAQEWGGQGGGNDGGKLRSKFAEAGYTIAEDGTIVADNPDLFSEDRNARGLDGTIEKKRARFRRERAETKEFRTPAYLEMQEFAGVSAAREDGARAREQGAGAREAGEGFFGAGRRDPAEGTGFATAQARGQDDIFRTGEDREGMAGIRNAPRADGIAQTAGYQSNASLTIDDVRKMLDPGTYADARGLD